ncbi:MAG: DUF1643 domain-containing protein [Planctomycetota bacterium]
MRYRYALTRRLRDAGPRVLFVMLNPSTATHDQNDPTVTRTIGFASRMGASRLDVCNCFGLRSTDPRGLRAVDDPAGPANTRTILARARLADRVVVAWGNHAGVHGFELAEKLERHAAIECLGVTNAGQPKHPLYIRADEPLRPYASAQASQSP